MIAQTILQQLGGSRALSVMTGAEQFTDHGNALSFKLPSNFATKGINYVKVTLDPSDTYTVEFSRIRGTRITQVSRHEDIYNDQLREVFMRETGLEIRVPRIVGVNA